MHKAKEEKDEPYLHIRYAERFEANIGLYSVWQGKMEGYTTHLSEIRKNMN